MANRARRAIAVSALVGLPVGLALVLAGEPSRAQPSPGARRAASLEPLPFAVERAADWEALFRRRSGWTGADGIFTIPLSGYDQPGRRDRTDTLILFSDTFLGEVTDDGRRAGGWTIVNNTLARLPAGAPDADTVRFFWRDDGGAPRAAFEPRTPNTEPGDWYWLMDGTALGDTVSVFALRMRLDDGGPFNFAVSGVSLITLVVEPDGRPVAVAQADTPLFVDDGPAERIFGGAVMANTRAAGAPAADGFLYVYGEESRPLKRLLAARVRPEQIADFGAWRFWDGARWTPDIDAAARLTSGISSEFSVTPLPDGRFALVYQDFGLGRDVAVRIGDTPVGPFSEPAFVWRAPEPDFDPDVFVYNAKAHPHLSEPGELLISYNVNTFQFADHLQHADIYRPRFIRLRFGGGGSSLAGGLTAVAGAAPARP